MNKDKSAIRAMDREKRLKKRATALEQKAKFAKCKQVSINVERMDFGEWFKSHDDGSVEKEMENIFGDVNTPEASVALESVGADNRLGRQQNGMVLLPRTFYNKHPLKQTVNTRQSSRREVTPPKEKKFKVDTRSKKKNSDISKNTQVTVLNSRVTKNSQKISSNGLKSKNVERMNSPSEEVTEINIKTEDSKISLKKLSPLMKPEILPSKLWEIDRIPPIVIPKLDHPNIQEAEKDTEIKNEIIDVNPLEEKMDIGAENKDTNENIKLKDEKSKDTHIDITVVRDTVSEETDSKISTEIASIEDSEKHQEEFPSIMDILNEKPLIQLVDDKPQPDVTLCDVTVGDDVEMETKADEAHLKEADPELPEIEESISEPLLNPEYLLKTVVFKRYTENKESCDRLVTFQFNLEYSVVINDKTIELLGAPTDINDIEDIKILLQIVDDISLDSFNIACKS